MGMTIVIRGQPYSDACFTWQAGKLTFLLCVAMTKPEEILPNLGEEKMLSCVLRVYAVFLGVMAMTLLPKGLSAQESWQARIRSWVEHGAVLAVNAQGKVLYSLNEQLLLVPASTLKVATAYAALKILGPDYHFKTQFYTDGSQNLYMKGFGDPFLVSEELSQVARALRDKGLHSVKDLILDDSYFDPSAQVPGLAGSLNPYDAFNGALVANFNTLNVIKRGDGSVASAEEQTPLTEITQALAQGAPTGKSRINVATHRDLAPLYAGYLLKAFLLQQGVQMTGQVRSGVVPEQAKLFLDYANSKNLAGVLQEGLKYSQNLIMNQIFLTLGAEKLGAPATLEKSRQVMNDFLKKEVGWKRSRVVEGSGISRENQVDALEMDQLLVAFFPHRDLLPQKNNMWVKTGTLTGVSSLVGYFQSPDQGWVRFVILLNQGAGNREKIAQTLQDNL